jgi:hypothetical protein
MTVVLCSLCPGESGASKEGGPWDGADSVTLTINDVNAGRNSPHRFRLALVTVEGDQASPPAYVSGVDWGLPGFGDSQITKNLQQLLAAGRAPH